MNEIIIAVPKGRILKEITPLFKGSSIQPEAELLEESSRKLVFDSSNPRVKFITVRSFDVATFVAFGAAHIGICGSDVMMEFDYPDLYSIMDLDVGKCRLSLAAPKEFQNDKSFWNESHIRVATKYVNLTKKYFAEKGIQAECIKLNGSIELAPKLGLCSRIVDLVSTGATLVANGLVEGEKIAEVSSRLIVNRNAYKTMKTEINSIIKDFEKR
jgi:ATP phosphoribosyltransferase